MPWCSRWSVRKFSTPGSGRWPAGRAYHSSLKPLLLLGYEGDTLAGVAALATDEAAKTNFFSGWKHGRLLRFYLPSPAAGGIRGWRIRRTRRAPSADIAAGQSPGRFSDFADIEGSRGKAWVPGIFASRLPLCPDQFGGPEGAAGAERVCAQTESISFLPQGPGESRPGDAGPPHAVE